MKTEPVATSQLEAAQRKESKFFTGRECKNGHTDFRYTHGGTCVQCNAENTARRREQIRELMAPEPALEKG